MTRINVAIRPQQLTDQHLIAEHHEIVRVPGLFKARLPLKRFQDLPKQFTLGTGHVLFFICRGKYTRERYKQIYEECVRRKFNVTNYENVWDVYNNTIYFSNYEPTQQDKNLLIQRITENLLKSKQTPLYYSKPITKEEAINLLK